MLAENRSTHRQTLPIWKYRFEEITRVVPEKGPQNGSSSSSSWRGQKFGEIWWIRVSQSHSIIKVRSGSCMLKAQAKGDAIFKKQYISPTKFNTTNTHLNRTPTSSLMIFAVVWPKPKIPPPVRPPAPVRPPYNHTHQTFYFSPLSNC